MYDAALRWMDSAACRGISPAVFFADEQTVNAHTYDRARLICAVCPVVADCLHHAMTLPETEGFWGGMAPAERTKYRRDQKCTDGESTGLPATRAEHAADRSSRADRRRRMQRAD